MRWFKLTAVAVLSGAAFGCSKEIESEPDKIGLESASLNLAALAPSPATASGYRTFLFSERDVDVYSRPGAGDFFEQGVSVMSINVEVGDRVTAGQVLASLENDEAQLEVDAAQARADEARANFKRMEELKSQELISPAEYDQALYAMRYADAALERAQLDLSRTRIRSPFTGVISRRYVRAGELVVGGTALFRVTAMSPLRARLLVPEAEAAAFRSGAPVHVTGANGETGTARTVVVGPTVDPGSGTREVLIELSEPGDFRPGSAVTAKPEPLREVD